MASAFDSALNPPAQTTAIWGEVTLFDATHVVLEKGVRGGTPFDASLHDIGKRVTRIDIAVQPITESPFDRLVERGGMIAEFGRDPWQKVTLPSLIGLGITSPSALEGLVGKFVKVELVKHGEYQKKDGTTGDLTALKFVSIFPGEEECVTDYYATFGTSNGAANGTSKIDDSKQKAARALLPALVRQAAGNMTALKAILASTPFVQDFYTLDSPEVQLLLQAEAA
jgi:hypothetical protein